MPIEGTVGLLRSAQLRADGTFHADKVPVGTVAIRLQGTDRLVTGQMMVDRYLMTIGQRALIHRKITGPPTPPMDIDLAVEAESFLRDPFHEDAAGEAP
jgi:hypothetical protein